LNARGAPVAIPKPVMEQFLSKIFGKSDLGNRTGGPRVLATSVTRGG